MHEALTSCAIRAAMNGDWHLLDAIEVMHRYKTDPGFAGILHVPGSMPVVGYISLVHSASEDAAQVECPACRGEGDLSADGYDGHTYHPECPRCHGDGYLLWAPEMTGVLFGIGEVRYWATLSGYPIDPHIPDYPGDLSDYWLNVARAQTIIAQADPIEPMSVQ